MGWAVDHLAVAATELGEGVAWLEERLGLPLAGGGQHAAMATHNRLIGMGDLYLEVIAPDPAAKHPGRPRWFDLDRFSGGPRLTNWVVRTDDMAADIAAGPRGIGQVMALQRGEFRWDMAVPDDGILPFAGAFPALIQWHGAAHPTALLPDRGLRLERLELAHPDIAGLRHAMAGRLDDPRVVLVAGTSPALRATLVTPFGHVVLA